MRLGTFSIKKNLWTGFLILALFLTLSIGGLILPFFQAEPEYIYGGLIFVAFGGFSIYLAYFIICKAAKDIEISADFIQYSTLISNKKYNVADIDRIHCLSFNGLIYVDIIFNDKGKIRITNKDLPNFENFVTFCDQKLKKITEQ